MTDVGYRALSKILNVPDSVWVQQLNVDHICACKGEHQTSNVSTTTSLSLANVPPNVVPAMLSKPDQQKPTNHAIIDTTSNDNLDNVTDLQRLNFSAMKRKWKPWKSWEMEENMSDDEAVRELGNAMQLRNGAACH